MTLVGHDLMSDELVAGASELARDRGVGLTFHMSPHSGDAASYLLRTGRRPFVHLDALGVLGPHVLVAHAVHLDDDEVEVVLRTDTAVASCPWAYLRLAQGLTAAGRHGELLAARSAGRRSGATPRTPATPSTSCAPPRCSSAWPATERWTRSASPPTTPSRWPPSAALEAIGKGDLIGSIEVGKQADLVVHDRRGPQFVPRSTDPVLQLMWASDGRSVRDVVIAGRHVVRDGRCVTVDLDALRDEAAAPRPLPRCSTADHTALASVLHCGARLVRPSVHLCYSCSHGTEHPDLR